jgi:predicted Zn-dependent protease with MMP-like domain
MRRARNAGVSSRTRRKAPLALREAAIALGAGEPRRALNLLPKKRDVAGWQLTARVHAALGQHAHAAEAYRRAQALDTSGALAIEAARHALAFADEDRPALAEVVRTLGRAREKAEPDELLAIAALEARALNHLGRHDEALAVVEPARARHPHSPELLLEAGIALFERCRFDEAQGAFEELVRLGSDEGWAHRHLALIAERKGETRRAREHEARARALLGGPQAVHLAGEAFEQIVARAIETLPSAVRRQLGQVPLRVEPLPSEADLRATHPPLSPSILGLFKGPPLGEGHGGREILLFQRNLERHCASEGELTEQIAVTLLHEVGHLLGLDEAALWARGLE